MADPADVLRTVGGAAGSPRILDERGDERSWAVAVPGAQALDAWRRLRETAPRTGHAPVVLGPDGRLPPDGGGGSSTAEILRRAEQCFADPAAWQLVRATERLQRLEASGAPDFLLEDQRLRVEELGRPARKPTGRAGRWPRRAVPIELSIPRAGDTGAFHEVVHLALVPRPHGWEAPACLRYGDWNACPPPEEHVARLRSWSQRYGAELFGLDGGTMELVVERPPRDRDEALALAWEQDEYSDVLDLFGTAAKLAAALLVSSVWLLWWD